MSRRWRRGLARRGSELRARTMVRVANRTFKNQPNRIDRFARRLVDKVAGGDS